MINFQTDVIKYKLKIQILQLSEIHNINYNTKSDCISKLPLWEKNQIKINNTFRCCTSCQLSCPISVTEGDKF
jgi:hypothetical protein